MPGCKRIGLRRGASERPRSRHVDGGGRERGPRGTNRQEPLGSFPPAYPPFRLAATRGRGMYNHLSGTSPFLAHASKTGVRAGRDRSPDATGFHRDATLRRDCNRLGDDPLPPQLTSKAVPRPRQRGGKGAPTLARNGLFGHEPRHDADRYDRFGLERPGAVQLEGRVRGPGAHGHGRSGGSHRWAIPRWRAQPGRIDAHDPAPTSM